MFHIQKHVSLTLNESLLQQETLRLLWELLEADDNVKQTAFPCPIKQADDMKWSASTQEIETRSSKTPLLNLYHNYSLLYVFFVSNFYHKLFLIIQYPKVIIHTLF